MTQQIINLGVADQGNGDPLRTAFQKVNSNFTELYTALGLNDNDLNLGSFEFTNNTMTTTDSSGIIIDQSTTVTSNLNVGGDIIPSIANGGDLGSSARPWRSLYVSNNTIYIGGNALKIDGNGDLTLNNNRIVQENGEFLVLDNLTDVSANSPSVGDVLAWNGGSWVNAGQATVPTLTSQLTNDAGFITAASIPTDFRGSVFADDSTLMIDAVGNKIYATELTVAVGNFVNVNSNNVDVENINGLASQINFTVGGYNNLVIENNLVTIQNVSLSVAGDITLGGAIRSEGAINIDINLSDSTLRRWQFGEDGILTLPSSAEAATLEENSGLLAKGRNVTLTATGLGFNGVVNIKSNSGANTWTFGNTGNLTIPGSIYLPGNIGIEEDNGSLLTAAPNHIIVSAGTDGTGTVSIKTNNETNEWLFAADGTLTLPGTGTIRTAFGAMSINAPTGLSNLSIKSSDASTYMIVGNGSAGVTAGAYNWQFSNTGNLTFPDSTIQTTAWAGNFGYLTADKDTVRGTAGYQYTFATDGYFTASTSSESTSYFFVTYNATNANIAAGWTVVGGTANTTVSSVTYPVAGYPGVIRVNLTAAASSTSGFYPVTVTSPDRLRVEIQPNPGTSDKFAFTTSGLTFPDATVQTTAFTGVASNIESENDVSIKVNLTDSTTHIWRFGEDGDLTLPNNQKIDATSATVLSVGSSNASVYLDSTNRVAKIIAKKHFNRSFDSGDGATLTYTSATVTVAFAANDGLYFKQLLSRLTAHFDGNTDFVYDYSNVTLTINPATENLASAVTNVVSDGNDPPTYTITLATAHAEPIIINDIVFDYDYNNTIGLDVDSDFFGIATDNDDLDLRSSRDIDLIAADDILIRAGSAMRIELLQNDAQNNTDGIEITTTSAADSKNWKFQFDGNLTIPGNIVHNTSPGLTIGSSYSVYIVGDQGDNDRTWTFDGTSGDLELPNGTIIADDDTNTQIRVPAAIPGTWKEWTFGVDGDLIIPGNIRSEGNINIDINLSDSTLRRWSFGEDGELTTPGAVTVGGILKIEDGVHEKLQTKNSVAGGTVEHDCSAGHIFYHITPQANWTVNLTNLSLANGYATAITIVIEQGATGYYPSAVQINGDAVPHVWQGNTTPTPSNSRIDVVTFSIINDGLYTVLGQLTGF